MKTMQSNIGRYSAFHTRLMLPSRLATVLSFLSAVSLAVHSPAAFAAVNPLGVHVDASRIDPTKVKPPTPDCQDVCKQLITGKLNKNRDSDFAAIGDNRSDAQGEESIISPSGNGPWNAHRDDLYCANHGFPTDATVTPTASPTPIGTDSTCQVPMTAEDRGDCAKANLGAMRCMLKNSQVENQCLALSATHDSTTFDAAVLVLDLAAAALCATACFAASTPGAAGGGFEIACAIAGGTATIGEAFAIVAQDTSPLAGTLHALVAGAGGAFAVGGTVEGGNLGIASANNNPSSNTFKDKSSCIAAAAFVILSGVRIYALAAMSNTYDDACNAIKTSWSDITAGNGAGGNTTTNPAQYTFNPSTGGFTQGGPGGSGGGSGTLKGSTAFTSDPRAAVTCAGTTSGSNCAGQASAATDSGAMRESGLDKFAAPIANKLLDEGLAKTRNAGQAMQSALAATGNGAGDAAGALAALAQQAQDHGAEVGAMIGMGTSAYSGGGGGAGGKAGGGAADNPFANLFGGGAKEGAARGLASAEFGKATPNDIWHTGTTMNLFQIISDKVSRVSSRVGAR